MDKTKVGVIGVGHLGKLHASLYEQVVDAQLVGIYDPDQKKANDIAEELSIQVFDSIEGLLENVEGCKYCYAYYNSL